MLGTVTVSAAAIAMAASKALPPSDIILIPVEAASGEVEAATPLLLITVALETNGTVMNHPRW